MKIWTRRDSARWGRSFKALFGIPFGPDALLTLRLLMASWTSSGLVNVGSLAGVSKQDLSAMSTISITVGTAGSVTGLNSVSRLSARASAFSV